jgi:hypothetical protein
VPAPALPIPFGRDMQCLRSLSVMVCDDERGNFYGIARHGADTFFHGREMASGRTWAQTSSRYGALEILVGLSSDGQVWLGTSRCIGWDVISRFSTSDGDRSRVVCNRLRGCD